MPLGMCGRAGRPVAVLFLLAALAAAGCGDSENVSSNEPIKPALKVPDQKISDAATDQTGATDDTSGNSTSQQPSGGNSGGAAPNSRPDSANNDTPPPANSPADTYEQFCKENPGACGD